MSAIKDKADQRARQVAQKIEDLKAKGVTSFNGIARALNEAHILTPRGGTWRAQTVKNTLERVA